MLTPRLILTQLLLVVIIWSVGKFGKKTLVLTTIILLFVSFIRLLTPSLFVLQITVILATAAIRYHKIREQEVKEMAAAFRNILDRLSGK
jgi:Flp pilus assembly protein TadB